MVLKDDFIETKKIKIPSDMNHNNWIIGPWYFYLARLDNIAQLFFAFMKWCILFSYNLDFCI